MHLKRVRVPNFRVLKDVDITFEPNLVPRIFPLGSANGGGKSTLLQLIFTLLHCCGDEKRIPYLQNMLDGFDIEDNSGYRDLATIDLVIDGRDLELKFFLSDRQYIDSNFDPDITKKIDMSDKVLNGIKGLPTELATLPTLIKEINSIFNQINAISLPIPTVSTTESQKSLHLKQFEEVRGKLTKHANDFKIICAKHNLIKQEGGNLESYISRLKQKESTSTTSNIYNDCQTIVNDFRQIVTRIHNTVATPIKRILATEFVSKNDSKYRAFTILTRGEKTDPLVASLACSFNVIDGILVDKSSIVKSITDNVFLAAPATQVFHFLPKRDRLLLFKTKENIQTSSDDSNYSSKINAAKSDLSGLFPYDTFSVDFLIDTLQEAIECDINNVTSTGDYGSNTYPKLVAELERTISTQKVNIDLKSGKITFVKTDNLGNMIQLYPEDLSHGELKRLSLYIWLKHHNIQNAIVLMDEVEIALHPDWQYAIINDLQTWAPNNQYILATHSYEMCQALTPTHVKEIEPKLLKQK
jgi:ABC-type dipeptide/oligopeptide/nickel transport system ATPase subunit